MQILYIAFAIFFAFVRSAEERTSLDQFIVPFRQVQNALFKNLRSAAQNPENDRTLMQQHKLQNRIPENVEFPCDVKPFTSPEIPQSVHELRPGDINIVGAIGDSLTAGYGLSATTIEGVLLKERGKSFSIGGEGTWRTYMSLPNILKEFNPTLFGYSLGPSLTIHKESQFNVAEGGAISNNTPYMAKVLIQRILSDERVDLQKHWKMITYFIGGNDFCSELCYYESPEITLDKHKEDLLAVLRLLRDNLPRTIIVVLLAPYLEVFLNVGGRPPICYFAQNVACPCLFGKSFESRRKKILEISRKWQEMDRNISNYSEFDRDDFTVVTQPFIDHFPTTLEGHLDYSFFAPDCFHLSQKANALVALSLWNAIMEPVGNKSSASLGVPSYIACPTVENPYIFTRRNSRNVQEAIKKVKLVLY